MISIQVVKKPCSWSRFRSIVMKKPLLLKFEEKVERPADVLDNGRNVSQN